MRSKKKAFTLTELLVVVIVIGILSAAILPKFNKVIETRKTTEAEEMMAAVRAEQEQRCTLNKSYTRSFAQIGEIAQGLNSRGESKNYKYTLASSSVSAASRGNYRYTLKMPSYADGRICCEGVGCASLNKDYPSCDSFQIASADTSLDTACAPTCTGSPQTRACTCAAGYTGTSTAEESQVCQSGEWAWPSANVCTSTQGCTKTCTGSAQTRNCSCPGGYLPGSSTDTETQSCDNGTWTWPSANVCVSSAGCTPDQDCAPDTYGSATSKTCGCDGTQTRTCNRTTGQWSAWGACQNEKNSKTEGTCGCQGNGTYNYTCVNHTWQVSTCTQPNTNCCSTVGATETVSCNMGATYPANCGRQTRTCGSTKQWEDGTCEPKTPGCCSSTKPSTPAEYSSCNCSNGDNGNYYYYCTNENTGNYHWSFQCAGCTGSGSGGCGPDPTGTYCTVDDPTSCGCYCSSTGPGDGDIPDMGLTTYNFENHNFSFYYAAIVCPNGTRYCCTRQFSGHKKNCHCTDAGWSCECGH